MPIHRFLVEFNTLYNKLFFTCNNVPFPVTYKTSSTRAVRYMAPAYVIAKTKAPAFHIIEKYNPFCNRKRHKFACVFFLDCLHRSELSTIPDCRYTRNTVSLHRSGLPAENRR